MVWESSNGGNFWTDEEKKIRLYARQRVSAAQQRRLKQLKRRVLWVALTFFGLGLAATVARSAALPGDRLPSLPQVHHTQVITVVPGDSLWSIARRYSQPGIATIELVGLISSLNGGLSGALEPGQRLVVPAP